MWQRPLRIAKAQVLECNGPLGAPKRKDPSRDFTEAIAPAELRGQHLELSKEFAIDCFATEIYALLANDVPRAA